MIKKNKWKLLLRSFARIVEKCSAYSSCHVHLWLETWYLFFICILFYLPQKYRSNLIQTYKMVRIEILFNYERQFCLRLLISIFFLYWPGMSSTIFCSFKFLVLIMKYKTLQPTFTRWIIHSIFSKY